MNGTQKWILGLFLVAILAVIFLTWGSIASAVLTLAMLLVACFLLTRWLMFDRENDFLDDEAD